MSANLLAKCRIFIMYIDYVSKFGKWLSDNFKQYQWEDYADVECTLADLWSNKYTLRNKVRLLRVIRQYAEEGIFPDGHNITTSRTTMTCSTKNIGKS